MLQCIVIMELIKRDFPCFLTFVYWLMKKETSYEHAEWNYPSSSYPQRKENLVHIKINIMAFVYIDFFARSVTTISHTFKICTRPALITYLVSLTVKCTRFNL